MGEVFLWNTPSNRWVTIRSFPVLGGITTLGAITCTRTNSRSALHPRQACRPCSHKFLQKSCYFALKPPDWVECAAGIPRKGIRDAEMGLHDI